MLGSAQGSGFYRPCNFENSMDSNSTAYFLGDPNMSTKKNWYYVDKRT